MDQAKKKKINEAKANGLPPPPPKKKNVKPPKKCSIKETDYELQDPIEGTNKSQDSIEEPIINHNI